VLHLLVVAYAALYLCRANIEPGLGILALREGYDNAQLGVVFSVALAAYAVGKVVLGALGDRIGGKPILLAAMIAAIVGTVLVGVVDWPVLVGKRAALWVIGAFVVLNRFGQAGGWGGVVHVAGQWFGPARRGAVMGVVSTSYDAGNLVTLLLCAGLVRIGLGWRSLFLVNPLLLAAVALLVWLALEGRPRAGLPSAGGDATPNDASAPEPAPASIEEPEGAVATFRRLATEPGFRVALVLSFLLTFVRAGFMTWTPRYLYDVARAAGSESAVSGSIAKSAFFGAAGMLGSVVVGRLSDRWGPGRRSGIMSASLALLVLAVLALAHGRVADPLGAALVVGLAGLFLLGPYSLLAGAIALDVGGKRGAATAAGALDGVGYVGASLSALVLGIVSKRHGWGAAFDVVAGVALLAQFVATAWWWRTRSSAHTS